jgi:hypothetical protein
LIAAERVLAGNGRGPKHDYFSAMEKPPGDEKTFRPRIGGRGGRSRFERAPHFAPSVLAAAGARYAALAGWGVRGRRDRMLRAGWRKFISRGLTRVAAS